MPRETRRPQKINNSGIKIALLLIIVAAAILFAIMQLSEPTRYAEQAEFTAAGVGLTYSRSVAGFHATDNGFFFFNGDAISFYGTDLLAMNQNVYMNNPSFSGRGDFAVILEQGGRTARVFNEAGEIFTAITNDPILNYSLSAAGHLTLITSGNDIYTLHLFGTRGELLLSNDLTHERHIPIASDVSRDGRRMALAFLDISGAELNFIVFLYQITDNTAAIVASNGYNHGQMLSELRFMGNNNLITISDSEIRSYNENGAIIASVPIGNVIDAVSFTDSYIAMALGENHLNRAGEVFGTILFLNENLTRVSTFVSNNPVLRLSKNHNSALITAGRELIAVSSSGDVLWRRILTHDIIYAAFLQSTQSIIVAGNEQAQVFYVE